MSWEKIDDSFGGSVSRRVVPGGWIYRVGRDAAVFVPYPPVTEIRSHEWEHGHKAGYMQALANHAEYEAEGDKVTPDRGFDAGYNEAAIEANKKATDRDNASYKLGYNRGFNDGLSGTGPVYEAEYEPVNPHDSEQVALRATEGDKVTLDQGDEQELIRRSLDAYEQGFEDGVQGNPHNPSKVTLAQERNLPANYPKYLVIGTIRDDDRPGHMLCMTHGLFDTREQASAYAEECHPGYNCDVVELARPLYVREGK